MVEFDYQELVRATESFSPSRLIGKGSHGSVYKGILQRNNLSNLVAIKKSSTGVDNVSGDSSEKIENEICVLSSLRESPYIINFLGTSHHESGAAKNEKNKVLVMEFMPNGSLYDLLHAASTPPSWPKRAEIAMQIAKAVQFLHESEPLVIHRDIMSANVLFDSDWNAKLADYGLAVLGVDSSADQANQPAGTIGYLDPFYTTPSKLSTKNDIFSYGVVLLEMISCQKVIDVCRAPASIVEWAVRLIKKQRPTEICDKRIPVPAFMEGTIKHLLHVAALCVSSKEETRPSMSEIVMGWDNSLVERVRIPSWRSLARGVILMRRKRKWQKQRGQAKGAALKCNVHSGISRGKMLWEILADITLE